MDLNWRKSSHSDVNGQCVEVARRGGHVALRDSKDPGPRLALTPAAWSDLLDQARAASPSPAT